MCASEQDRLRGESSSPVEDLSRVLASGNDGISIADRRSIAEVECLLRQVQTTSSRFFDV